MLKTFTCLCVQSECSEEKWIRRVNELEREVFKHFIIERENGPWQAFFSVLRDHVYALVEKDGFENREEFRKRLLALFINTFIPYFLLSDSEANVFDAEAQEDAWTSFCEFFYKVRENGTFDSLLYALDSDHEDHYGVPFLSVKNFWEFGNNMQIKKCIKKELGF